MREVIHYSKTSSINNYVIDSFLFSKLNLSLLLRNDRVSFDELSGDFLDELKQQN